MTDREKVIKGLEVCTSIEDGESCPKKCPYYQDVCYGYDQLMRDALALLKEQEAELQKGRYYSDVFDIGYKAGKESIVLCKDCKNADYGIDEDGNRFMKCIGSVKCYGGTTPDFFCADGVMRE